MKQKHFVDIEQARFEDTEFRQNNVAAFVPGDIIQISEKIDGSNASVAWDEDKQELACFSRKQPLNFNNTLRGFYNYVQSFTTEQRDWFKFHPQITLFGEWGLNDNKIKSYATEWTKEWIVYDAWNSDFNQWMPQTFVKRAAAELGLHYIHVLYEGPFISWDHIKSFLHKNTYGDSQEGVIVKNQTRLEDIDNRMPSYLKIVNDSFKEAMKTRGKKEKSADEIAEEARVNELVNSIVTQRRVEKSIERLRDNGILPTTLTPTDMKLVAKYVPADVFNDCIKEEPEIVKAAGPTFSKLCSSVTMAIARKLIVG